MDDTHTTLLWGYSSFDERVPYDILDFRVSRHRDGSAEFLQNYAGHVMADCYSGNQSVVLDVERRSVNLGAEACGELRERESKGLLDRLRTFLSGPVAGSVLPASKLGWALQYIRNHWQALTEYAKSGALPIDNNQVERLMNRVAVGRKNWLFVALVASAQRQSLELPAYLESVTTHLVRGTARPEELLPEVWRLHHPESVREYREKGRRDKADTAVLQAARRRILSGASAPS